MFNQETSDYFYKQISLIISEKKDIKQSVISLFLLFKEIINNIISKESQSFSSFSSKMLYVVQNYGLPEDLTYGLNSLKVVYGKSHSKDLSIAEKQLNKSYYTIIQLIDFFSDSAIPAEFQDIILKAEKTQFFVDKKFEIKKQNFEGLLFISSDKSKNEIYCSSEEIGLIKIKITSSWSDILTQCTKGQTLNAFNLKSISNQNNTYTTTLETLIVLEPDLLYDATEIAECFDMKGYDVLSYFIKKLDNSEISDSMIVGNYVNTCFDELLTKENVQFEELWEQCNKYKPLTIFSLAFKNGKIVNQIKDKVEIHFENLKNIVAKIKKEKFSIEPSFISPIYGLQGRLDAMLEYFDEDKKKDIIELKSGKSPDGKIVIKSDSGKNVALNVWNNHHAQATCYNMLLDSAFENRGGTSSILYSSSVTEPLRNSENIFFKKQEILKLRNQIVAYEAKLRKKDYQILDILAGGDYDGQSSFIRKPLERFKNIYKNSDDLEREYFQHYISFIHNELYCAKVGTVDNRTSGFASVWQSSIDEKKEHYSILSDLKINHDESDFENYHLKFNINPEKNIITSLRNGDMVILYSVAEDGSIDVLRNQLIKCVIKEISDDFVRLSLRNKQFDRNFFSEDKSWIVETDYIDSNNKKLIGSLYELLKANFKKKGLLLGLIEPTFENFRDKQYPNLNENQNLIVNKALSAKDYFLIQGPPGTGKTSYVLKTLVEELYNNPKSNLLVLAYTNRAVDEICSAIKKIEPPVECLRTGSKESSIHQDILISALTDSLSLHDLYIKVRNTRVIISTVSSVVSNSEIMDMKHYDYAIVDEATQILEPQIIGILTKVEKFILIGDEKQLPAVVVQEEFKTKVDSEILKNIQLENLSNSLFERLLKRCTLKNWNAYDILKYQARMHKSIQEFPNKYFYDNKLLTMPGNEWQNSDESKLNNNSSSDVIKLLIKNRVVFINTEKELKPKVNIAEAKIVKQLVFELIENLGENFNENSIGIISPFRAQCAEIYRQIGFELKHKILCDTVERFQGSEKDIIIISLAVNYEHQLPTIQSIAQFGDTVVDRKLNVAMTRAKEYLIILGNASILKKSVIYSDLINDIRGVKGYIEYL